jgi:hypothetical protein
MRINPLFSGRGLMLVFLVSFTTLAASQSRRALRPDEVFEAGIMVGFNLSQMDGDYFTGFDKVGWYAGLQGIVNLNRQMSLHLEMLYSQKGSRIPHGVKLDSRNEVRDRLIDLHYMDVPILLHYQLTQNSKSGYLEIGPVISQLIQTNIEEKAPQNIEGTVYREIQSSFESRDISLLMGVGVPLYRDLHINFRYQYGLRRFYTNADFMAPIPFSSIEKEVEFLRNYHFSIALSYHFLRRRR